MGLLVLELVLLIVKSELLEKFQIVVHFILLFIYWMAFFNVYFSCSWSNLFLKTNFTDNFRINYCNSVIYNVSNSLQFLGSRKTNVYIRKGNWITLKRLQRVLYVLEHYKQLGALLIVVRSSSHRFLYANGKIIVKWLRKPDSQKYSQLRI